tara:strand:+ start:833 stop:1021 length:189 start_codon:yes stop_codon:yes gene_type:complete
MTKEYEIENILNAVNSIFEKKRKKGKSMEIKIDSANKSEVLPLNNQVKSGKSDVLVLDEMIE